jgi:hypothetical protein
MADEQPVEIPEGVTLPDPARSIETRDVAPIEDVTYDEEAQK